MRIARFYGDEKVKIEHLPLPEPNNAEVRIKVAYASICGSDIAIYRGLNKRAVYPVVPGHEFVGEIDKLPENYKGSLKIRDRVAVIPTVSCGFCWGCKNGLRHICDSIKFRGIQFDGGFAEYAIVEHANVRKLPNSLEFALGVLTEPLAVAVHAVSFAPNLQGKKVLVFGAGPIGLMTAIVAREKGALVYVSELQDSRRNAAKLLGFNTINPSEANSEILKQKETDGIGFDGFFECAGHPSTYETMIQLAKQRSFIIVVATYKTPPVLDLFMMSRKEMHIDIAWTYLDSECEEAMEMLNKKPTLFESLITHTFDLNELDSAMKCFIEGGDALKVSIMM